MIYLEPYKMNQMINGLFSKEAVFPDNHRWEKCVSRLSDIYQRKDEIRSEFERDYNRILHSTAYRRLKHKTQVFYATSNDHICTRIEHVNHVTSVSYTIAKFLGLNTELTRAIAIGHDLGHAPFGHSGEKIINALAIKEANTTFWHEQNGLRIVDSIELLEDEEGRPKKLNLTYAVRDGIVSHCGEVNENAIFPRQDFFNLYDIKKANEFQPYTWEACVVKIADKISYLGRDIEDAYHLKILNSRQIDELKSILGNDLKKINNTILMHTFITDLCTCRPPEKGICLSENMLTMINRIKEYNYNNIYRHQRLLNYFKYAELIIHSIFFSLLQYYDGDKTSDKILQDRSTFPVLTSAFNEWMEKYSGNIENQLYNLKDINDYKLAIFDYISSLTDYAAINIFNELSSF